MDAPKKVSRLITTVAAIGALSLTLTACGGDGGGAGADGTTTITYLSWNNEEQATPVIEAFEAANPDVKVEVSFAPPVAEYIQTLQTRIVGNQAPDVFRIAPENRVALIGEGHVADLSDLSFVDTLGEANRRAYTSDGKLYGASFGAWEAGVVYNKDLLAEVGVTEPPTDWDAFIELCKKLEAAGINSYTEAVDDIPRIPQGFFGDQYAVEGAPESEGVIFDGESTFADEWTEALTQWKRIYDEGIVGMETVSLTGQQVRDEFIAGNVAMFITGPWDLPALDESGVNFGMQFQPGIDGGTYGAGASDPGFAISAKTEGAKRDASVKLLEWLATPEALALQSEHWGSMSTSTAYDTEVNPVYQTIYAEGLKESKFYLSMEHWKRGADAIQVEATAQFQQMVQGQITPRQVGEALDVKLGNL
ncbi:ABC transporter substrate-binding protein [Tessaracoccus defluvii]|uniref:Extracellular solute-binding protein n=1 Tax=Tessaracoccus defluvii TaxID=1285901 RepID=A0A7H0H2X0_9ACTN|nr:extracellular solute-binding protein [Tessaracoccus defluvii]QNP54886.1 extracellular solute-binding protein [Tessaracoccus defluvii]